MIEHSHSVQIWSNFTEFRREWVSMISLSWNILSFSWNILSFPWNILSFSWYISFFSWQILSPAWNIPLTYIKCQGPHINVYKNHMNLRRNCWKEIDHVEFTRRRSRSLGFTTSVTGSSYPNPNPVWQTTDKKAKAALVKAKACI